MKLCKSEIETRKPKFENYKIYWQMFFTFVRIGSVHIWRRLRDDSADSGGSGQRRRKWIDEHEFIDMLAMAQSAPGHNGNQHSHFYRLQNAQIKGSVVTALGTALPSFIIILLVAMVFTSFQRKPDPSSGFSKESALLSLL